MVQRVFKEKFRIRTLTPHKTIKQKDLTKPLNKKTCFWVRATPNVGQPLFIRSLAIKMAVKGSRSCLGVTGGVPSEKDLTEFMDRGSGIGCRIHLPGVL